MRTRAPSANPFSLIRWRIFTFLFGFGFLAYMQQKSVTIAAERIEAALHLSQFQLSLIEQAFLIGYALFQIPGGVLGQRLGARRAFVVIGIGAFAAVLALPLAPFLFAGVPLFAALLAAQLLLGVAQAGIFPVSSGVFEAWFPPHRWALVQGLQTMGLGLGAALTAPLIANLMALVGWQRALIYSSAPALALIGLWAWYGRGSPREHPSVSAEDLSDLDPKAAAEVDSKIGAAQFWRLLKNPNVLLLSGSYFCMNYAFYLLSNWSFLYLKQARHFSEIQSGWLAAAPPLAAALGAGLGGWLTGILCKRHGTDRGLKIVPLVALPASAVLLVVAVGAANPYVAVIALSVCFGIVELTEGAFWAASMSVGRGDAMAVGGIMNTGGNLGGMIGIPIVGYLTGLQAWREAFLIGSVCALVSAVGWLGIRTRDE